MAKAKKVKTASPKKKKLSLKERVEAKRAELKKKGSRSSILRQKEEGTIRIRIMKVEDDGDFWHDLITFWLNKDLGDIKSPATFGDHCPAMDKFQELRDSDDEEDIEFSKKLSPRTKHLIPVVWYKDDKGKKVDKDNSGKLLQIPNRVLQEITSLYLDEDEWGDMTDPKNGYDLKITREGKGQFDTTYSIQPCKNTPIPKEYRKPINLEEMVKEEIDDAQDIATRVEKWLDSSGEVEDDEPKKKKKKGSKSKAKKKSKKKRKKDI